VNVGVEDPDRAVHLLAQNGVSAEPGIRGTQPSEWRYVTVQQRDLRRARAVLGSR
jgi:hypothetical protein